MNAFFQRIFRWFLPRKKLIESEVVNIPEEPSVAPIDNTYQKIELTCHQIEQSIESIRSDIRRDKDNAGVQLLRCKKLITDLDNAMQA
ncbi:hypothetical protein RCF98_09685 [Thiothrix lacustris]|jgi:hypothetical protein|uniref:Uncharacterized protein n=1 Tax=Thiothrix lacustris TaxID=525917 RepID=A0ABY9MKN6_9GAMM|nr:hypothetical protein [Thiothrix lacustris]WML89244.1 hypothetical protein RCF98_09685 [Thiothrix lacustris]